MTGEPVAATPTPAAPAEPTPAPAPVPEPVAAVDPAPSPAPAAAPADPALADPEPVPTPAEPQAPTYELPEGFQMNPQTGEALQALATENNWDQATLQKVVDLGVEWQNQQQQALATQVQAWTDEVRKDPEIGGENLDQNIAKANQVLSAFGNPELVKMLKDTGLSNHPGMVRMFHKLHGVLGEDTLVSGQPTPAPVDRVANMYPSMQK